MSKTDHFGSSPAVQINPAANVVCSDTRPSSPLDWAQWHVDVGFKVFPCNAATKAPLVTGWQKNACNDPDQIEKWWNRWPEAMIGVATGKINKIVVLDVDVKNDVDGFQTIDTKGFFMSPGYSVDTPSGGAHFYFRLPATAKSALRSSVSKVGSGLDVRGEGGYVIGAGSVNAQGGRYILCSGAY